MTESAQLYAQAVDELNRGNWRRAYDLASMLLRQGASLAGVHFVAGFAAMEMHRLQAAKDHLKQAATLNPQRVDYKMHLARALAKDRSMKEAVEVADQALAMAPQDTGILDALGVIYTQANAHRKAVDLFRRVATIMPAHAGYRFNLATSLTFAGDFDGAEHEYEACIGIDPLHWKAHLGLSQLRKWSASRNHIQRLESLLPMAADNDDGSMYLNLALAKEYEDLQQFARSFDHLSRGKAAKRTARNYSSARDEELFDALASSFQGPESSRRGCGSSEPIFVVGMPRSGTTLVERILSSHPAVHSSGELQNFGVCLKRASGSRTPYMLDADTIARSRDLDWRRLGEAYVESTRPDTGHVAHFIDKLPHNFLYLGYIARALPEARIIHLHRDPIDTCLSNFRQLFALTSPYYDYSFNLMDTGRYYLMYQRLMQHWHRALPGRILDVRYEDLVDSQETETERMLEFCDLPWNDACLRFEDNDAPVATASATQVRQSMNRTSLQRWKKYEDQIGDLIALLQDAAHTG
jgi:tetratricopeptide (TPR) repeat protein